MSSSRVHFNMENQPRDHLIQAISPWVAALGYQVIHLEVQSHHQKVLRVFIDHLNPDGKTAIGIEDCVKVSHALSDPLDQISATSNLLQGSYELEVSSPGINRPLRTAEDFNRFQGHRVRIHVFRPLTCEEIGDPVYQQKNPKQKNFLGLLKGLQDQKVLLSICLKQGEEKVVSIPLLLISKANLEPDHQDIPDSRQEWLKSAQSTELTKESKKV